MEDRIAQPLATRGRSPLAALAAFAAVVVLVVGLAVVRPPLDTPPPASGSPPDGSASPASAAEIECHRVVAVGEASAAPTIVRHDSRTVRDLTGLVRMCTIAEPFGIGDRPVSVTNFADEDDTLRVTWQGNPCDAAADLVFGKEGADYYLLVTPRRRDIACEEMLVAHAVMLHLSQPVDASRVAARMGAPATAIGADTDVTSAGTFNMQLTAPRATFVAGEVIDGIVAELTYDGPAETVAVAGVGQLIPGFRTEMVDGPYATGPGWDEPCVPDVIARGVPVTQPYQKNGGWDPQGPFADFYADFFAEPELRLPAGRWRITAYSEFFLGECGGEIVRLQASVELDVRDSASSPTPPLPTQSAHSVDRIACQRVGRLFGTPPPLGWSAAVEDTTGLLTHCMYNISIPGPSPEPIVITSDEHPLSRGLSLSWMGLSCLSEVTVRFGRTADGLALDVTEQPADTGCDGLSVLRQLFLISTEHIDPWQVMPSLNGEPGPVTPEPTPDTRIEREVECEYGAGPPEVTVFDHAGLVRLCYPQETDLFPVEDAGAINPDGDENLIWLGWMVDDICGRSPARIDIWPRTPAQVARSTDPAKPYLIVIDRDTANDDPGCSPPAPGARYFELWLERPVSADDVEVVLLHDGVGRDEHQTPFGELSVTIEAGPGIYLADEPIELATTLQYSGATQTLNLSGSAGGMTVTTVEQLDGDLYFGPAAWRTDCSGRWIIENGQPLEQPLGKSGTFSADDPDAAIYRAYYEHPELRLPAGTWLITAHSLFDVGNSCTDAPVRLIAAVVVRVIDSP
jgi:hypothetical protein